MDSLACSEIADVSTPLTQNTYDTDTQHNWCCFYFGWVQLVLCFRDEDGTKEAEQQREKGTALNVSAVHAQKSIQNAWKSLLYKWYLHKVYCHALISNEKITLWLSNITFICYQWEICYSGPKIDVFSEQTGCLHHDATQALEGKKPCLPFLLCIWGISAVLTGHRCSQPEQIFQIYDEIYDKYVMGTCAGLS